MSNRYWMVSNRNVIGEGLGSDRAALTYWTTTASALDALDNWKSVDAESFRESLIAATDKFPTLDAERHQQQRHVTLAIHGFNVDWTEAVAWYKQLCDDMFAGPRGLGICVLFTWPSDGMATNYLPDRMDAEKTAPDLADLLSSLYDWLLQKQREGSADPAKGCKAKTSVIAHSMGNYVLQRAMQFAWTRKNQPLLVSLLNQLLMIAADVDNDLFKSGESNGNGDGDAIANLTYRVTALYSGRDNVLGLSAGMKHFGKRRLGRSGLDRTVPVPDNVWDLDASKLFKPSQKNTHSAYFVERRVLNLMSDILRGVDRSVILNGLR